jgi:hypothetical protein
MQHYYWMLICIQSCIRPGAYGRPKGSQINRTGSNCGLIFLCEELISCGCALSAGTGLVSGFTQGVCDIFYYHNAINVSSQH